MKNDEGQLIIFREKVSCLKSKETSISKILKNNADAEKCLELKIMHCSQLASISVFSFIFRELKNAKK
jgi:hypothetical protein